jgi:hypothetical protein
MSPPLTLGDFRRQTAHLPDDTLLVTYKGYECEEVLAEGWVVEDYVVEWNLPERRATIAELLTGMGGPGRTPKRTQPAIVLN